MKGGARFISYVQIIVLGTLSVAIVSLVIVHRRHGDAVRRLETRVDGLQSELRSATQRLEERFEQAERRMYDETRAVTAAAFHLIGSNGRVVASLAVREHGGPALVLNGPQRQAVVLEASPDGAGRLTTYHATGHEMLRVGPGPSGEGTVSVMRPDGQAAFEVVASAAGGGAVVVYGTNAAPIVRLEEGTSGGGIVSALDAQGEQRAGMGVYGGHGFLTVRGVAGGKAVVRVGVSESGHGAVTTYDAAGRTTVSLDATPEGAGSVVTYGPGGAKLVSLGATDAGGGMVSTHARGLRQVELGANPAGDAQVSTFNRDGVELVRIGAAAAGGNGYLSTYDVTGQGRVSLGVTGDGDGIVSTYGSEGNRLAGLGVAEDGSGVVSAHNAAGREVAVLGALQAGAGFLSTFTPTANPLVHLGARTDGSALIAAYGPEGDRRFTAGGSGMQVYGSQNRTIASIGRDTNGDGIMVLNANSSKSQVRIFAGVTGGGLATFDRRGEATDQFPNRDNLPQSTQRSQRGDR